MTLRDHKRQEIFLFPSWWYEATFKYLLSGYRPAEVLGFGMMRWEPFILFLTRDWKVDPSIWAQKNWKIKSLPLLISTGLRLWAKKIWISQACPWGRWCPLLSGALYSPHAILVRNLCQSGDIAASLKFKRQMSLEHPSMMQLIIGQVSQEGSVSWINTLLGTGWPSRFQGYDLILAYMRDDDYDQQAYPDILEALYELPVRIISTSRAGRHNDAVVRSLFVTQYKEITWKETLEETNDKNKNESRTKIWGDTVLADYLWGSTIQATLKEASVSEFPSCHGQVTQKTWYSQTNFGATRQILVCPCSKRARLWWLSRWKRLAHTVMVRNRLQRSLWKVIGVSNRRRSLAVYYPGQAYAYGTSPWIAGMQNLFSLFHDSAISTEGSRSFSLDEQTASKRIALDYLH